MGRAGPRTPRRGTNGAVDLDELAAALGPVIAHAEACYPREACGLGFEDAGGRIVWAALPNASPRPETAFALDDAAHLAALSTAPGPVQVVYHSHCDAPPDFSAADRAGALIGGREAHPGARHLVLTVRAGQAREGRIYRYDPATHRFEGAPLPALGVPSEPCRSG